MALEKFIYKCYYNKTMPAEKSNLFDTIKNVIFPVSRDTTVDQGVAFDKHTLSSPFPLMTWKDYGSTQKQLHPYYGVVSSRSYASTGMPWLSSDARKAVKTEWFWQPIRGQPRRVDTNELRKYANTVWIQSIVMYVTKQVAHTEWDIVPIDEETPYEQAKEDIEKVKNFFLNPNKNDDSWADIVSSWIKDVLEIDAGVIVKVYTIDSYDFEHLEPRSGAPLLKPLVCPECSGKKNISRKRAMTKAYKIIEAINKSQKDLPEIVGHSVDTNKGKETISYQMIKPDYEPIIEKMSQVISANSLFGENDADVNQLCPFCNGTGKGRQMKEIYVQDGASFLKDTDKTGWTYGYWQYSYAIPAHPMWFNRDEVIYCMANPRGLSVYGYSPMQSSLNLVKSLEYSVRHNMSLFLDGAVPDGVVSVEDMSNEELIRMKNSWENNLKGQPHKVIFLNKKTTFSPFAFNNRDMQFLESQRIAWQQVMSNFQVTPVDLGFIEDASRATAGTSAEMGRRKAIRPILRKIEQLVNDQLLPELGVSQVKYKYLIEDPIEKRMNAEINKLFIDSGIKSVNEVRIEMGLPPVNWGDGPRNQFGFSSFDSQFSGRSSEQEGIDDTVDQANNDMMGAAEKGMFSAQTPYDVTVNNLSAPLPFVKPKQGHPNTQEPYRSLDGLCPKCGSEAIMRVNNLPDYANLCTGYQCQQCGSLFSADTLKTEQQIQEDLHNKGEKPDPFVRPQKEDEQHEDIITNKKPFKKKAKKKELEVHKGCTCDTCIEKSQSVVEGFLEAHIDKWIGWDTEPLTKFFEDFLAKYMFEDVKDITTKQRKGLRAIFIEAFTKGKTLTEMIKAVENLGFDNERSDLIVRTESVKISNNAKINHSKSMGYTKGMFLAILDARTCEICMDYDGKVMSLDKLQKLIPVHPRCRCTYTEMA